MIGQVILDTVLRPIFAIWITIAQNYQKALLYFVLLCLSGLIIGLTCLCGNWIATKCLLPIERDIYAVRRAQRTYADEHINDTRIVIDHHLRGSPTESRYSANGKNAYMYLFKSIKKCFVFQVRISDYRGSTFEKL